MFSRALVELVLVGVNICGRVGTTGARLGPMPLHQAIGPKKEIAMFSLVPRCHDECGSAKWPLVPKAKSITACLRSEPYYSEALRRGSQLMVLGCRPSSSAMVLSEQPPRLRHEIWLRSFWLSCA